MVLRNLIVHQYYSTYGTYGFTNYAPNVEWTNCLVYDVYVGSGGFSTGIYNYQVYAGTEARIRNCTFYACQNQAVHEAALAARALLQNCAAFQSLSAFVALYGWNAASDYNAVDTGSAPGANSLFGLSQFLQFVNPSGRDFHLLPGSALVGAALDLTTAFTDDLEGTLRTGTWDIGADELGWTFYVDAELGDDTFDGLQPARAWPSVEKVNDEMVAGNLKPGDSVLFKRGQEFQGQLTITASGTSDSPITFGAYGPRDPSGSRPEDWQSPDEWPRIGYDVRIDEGTVWQLHATDPTGPTYRTAVSLTLEPPPDNQPGLGNYRALGSRDTIWLGPSLPGQGGLDAVIANPGRLHYDGTFLYVHLLDPNLNPTNVHVYVNEGSRDDETGHYSRVIDSSFLVFEGLHIICGRFGIRLRGAQTQNCLVQECLGTGQMVDTFIATNDSAAMTFRRNEVAEAGCGLAFTTGASGLAEDNYVHDLDPDLSRWKQPYGIDVEGILARECGDVEIVDNRIRDVGAAAILLFVAGGQSSGAVEIHRNRITGVFDKALNVGGAGTYTDVLFHHNLIISENPLPNALPKGIFTTEYSVSSEPIRIINNTFIDCWASWWHKYRSTVGPEVSWQNNISVPGRRHIVDDKTPPNNQGTHIRDYNCYKALSPTAPQTLIQWEAWPLGGFGKTFDGSPGNGFAEYQNATCDGADTCSTQETSCLECKSIERTVAEIALDAGYKLTVSSPDECKSGGADLWSSGGTLDFDGNPVPNGSGETSMGAFQWP